MLYQIASPITEFVFNRVIRDKLPGIQDLKGEYSDSAQKDRNCVSKQKSNELADKKRGAKIAAVRYKVLLNNFLFPHKLIPSCDTTEYVATERTNKVAAMLLTSNNNKSKPQQIVITIAKWTIMRYNIKLHFDF